MILQDIVNVLRREEPYDDKIAQETEKYIMQRAKIVVSTLNYCGSARLHQLKYSTEFVIIDEGRLLSY